MAEANNYSNLDVKEKTIMDSSSNSQGEGSLKALELFPRKRRRSKYNPILIRKKKKANTKRKVEPEPDDLIESATISDVNNSDQSGDDKDDKDAEEEVKNVMEIPRVIPTVLHAVRNDLDIFAVVCMEIALEGLDGITLEALWKRLLLATGAHLNDNLRIFIWDKLKENPLLHFYELPEKRCKLDISKRFDEQLEDYIIEVNLQAQDIYSVESLKIDGVFGACDSFSTRTDITKKVVQLTLTEMEVCYGNKMVIVADDKLRTLILFTEFHDPNVLTGYSELLYRLLERIARSRSNGEINSGKLTIGTMCRDARSMFYYRRVLENANVIVSQPITFCIDGQSQTGILMQLQRFYSEKKLKKQRLIECLVNLLKSQPQNLISYSEFLRRIGQEQWQKLRGRSVLKCAEVNAIINKTMLPYRVVHPNAPREKWRKINKNEERYIYTLQLKDPNINLQQHFSKEDPGSDNSSEDEDTQPMSLNFCLSRIAYKIVYDAGPNGISFRNFIVRSGIDYYSSRRLLTSLTKRKIVTYKIQDCGSQRLKNYIAARFCNGSSGKIASDIMEQAEDCDDDTIDFIANVLHIDSDHKHHLKERATVDSNNSFINNTETKMGEYEAIKLMRSMNTMSADCKVIYENKHPYEKLTSTQNDITIQLQIPSVKIDDDIRDLFSKIDQIQPPSSDRGCWINSFVIDIKLEDVIMDPPKCKSPSDICFYNIKEIKEFYPILEKHNLIQKKAKLPRFKIILNRASKLINRMRCSKDGEDYTSNLSADEEDVELPQTSSMIVNFEDIDEIRKDSNNVDEIRKDSNNVDEINAAKNTILNYFEVEDVVFSNYLLNIENDVRNAEKRTHEDNSCPLVTKRAKLNPHLDAEVTEENNTPFIKKTLISYVDMGPNPDVLKVCKYMECEVTVVASTKPERYVDPSEGFTGANCTPKVIERAIIIIDYIRSNNVVNDLKLTHHVQIIEKMRGHQSVIDKKTLFRNTSRLITLGYIRAVKLLFKVKKYCRSKLLFFVPNFVLFPYLNSTIDIGLFSLRTYAKKKANLMANFSNINMNVPLPNKQIPTNPNYKTLNVVSYRYGYLQKYSRVQLLHQFMYYLIYGYADGCKCEDTDLTKYFDDEESLQQLPEVYKNEISWRMFIPSLPTYTDYPEGWACLVDVVMRMPLSIFVRVCSVAYIIPELPDYLNHPVKRHILVKDLPLCIIDALYCYRRYVDVIFQVFCYLCYMGLLQLGPKNLNNKFDMHVYLNRQALIYDTTTSNPGYHEVSDKVYEKLSFYFNSEEEITRFWSLMLSTCVRSKLGFRYSILGKLITLENIHAKQSMVRTLSPVTPAEAVERDVGYIPGNHRGAGGYDSGLWIHSRRNWNFDTSKSKETRYTNPMPQAATKAEANTKTPNLSSQRRTKKIIGKQKASVKVKRKLVLDTKVGNRNSSNLVRRLVKERIRNVVKDRYVKDELDQELKEIYSGVRAKYNQTEILALTVCLEVLKYMKSARHGVSMICIRDFMHRVCKDAVYKKTSSAYRRRLLHIESSTRDLCSRDSLFLRNLSSDTFAQKYYKSFLKRSEARKVGETETKIAFLYLSYFTMIRHQTEKPTYSFKNYLNNDTVRNVELIVNHEYPNATYVIPDTKDDIKRDTLQSLIHCCLTCNINDDNWRSVLLKAFYFYSEESVRSIVKNMQMHQILSSKKGLGGHHVNDGVLLVTGKTYQLSFGYCFNQITNYPSNIFQNALNTVSSVAMEKHTSKISIEAYENENLLGLFEISSINTIQYEVEETTDILTINPSISDHTLLIKELVRRCGFIVRNIILQSVASKDDSTFSIQNVENIISKLINTDSSASLEGIQLIENIVENSQYLDKDADDENTYPAYDSKSIQNTEHTLQVESRTTSIYGLKSLLTKGLFPELDDDDKLEEFENHFTPKYPNVSLDLNCCADFMSSVTHATEKLSDIIDDLERDAVYNLKTTPANIAVHFDEQDCLIAQSLVDFVRIKEALGATLAECYDLYKKFSAILSFQEIMQKLIHLKHIMIHGVTSLTVIHINFIEYWTIPLDSATSGSKYVDKTNNHYRVKLMPWMKVDGTIHIVALENWLCTILSHCLSYPQATVISITKRFPYIKPVDTYTILKVIKRLGCISLNTYETKKITTLFNERTYIDIIPAPYYCDIPNLAVSVETCAILKLGQAIKDFKAP